MRWVTQAATAPSLWGTCWSPLGSLGGCGWFLGQSPWNCVSLQTQRGRGPWSSEPSHGSPGAAGKGGFRPSPMKTGSRAPAGQTVFIVRGHRPVPSTQLPGVLTLPWSRCLPRAGCLAKLDRLQTRGCSPRPPTLFPTLATLRFPSPTSLPQPLQKPAPELSGSPPVPVSDLQGDNSPSCPGERSALLDSVRLAPLHPPQNLHNTSSAALDPSPGPSLPISRSPAPQSMPPQT